MGGAPPTWRSLHAYIHTGAVLCLCNITKQQQQHSAAAATAAQPLCAFATGAAAEDDIFERAEHRADAFACSAVASPTLARHLTRKVTFNRSSSIGHHRSRASIIRTCHCAS
eukprot:6194680-Pleurochrysis_carterae.AAC.1